MSFLGGCGTQNDETTPLLENLAQSYYQSNNCEERLALFHPSYLHGGLAWVNLEEQCLLQGSPLVNPLETFLGSSIRWMENESGGFFLGWQALIAGRTYANFAHPAFVIIEDEIAYFYGNQRLHQAQVDYLQRTKTVNGVTVDPILSINITVSSQTPPDSISLSLSDELYFIDGVTLLASAELRNMDLAFTGEAWNLPGNTEIRFYEGFNSGQLDISTFIGGETEFQTIPLEEGLPLPTTGSVALNLDKVTEAVFNWSGFQIGGMVGHQSSITFDDSNGMTFNSIQTEEYGGSGTLTLTSGGGSNYKARGETCVTRMIRESLNTWNCLKLEETF